MLVRNRMSVKLATVDPQQSIDAARALLRRHRIHHLPVLRGQRLVGIVTDRDLRSAPPAAKAVAEVMTAKPLVIRSDVFVDEAARLLRKHRIGALPVVDRTRLVGILTASDVLDAFVAVSGVAEGSYQLILAEAKGRAAVPAVRAAVQKGRGELKWVQRDSADAARLHLRVKAPRIDDVTTALEAAGFEVSAVIASAPTRAA